MDYFGFYKIKKKKKQIKERKKNETHTKKKFELFYGEFY